MNRKAVRVLLLLAMGGLVITAGGCASGAPATPTPAATVSSGTPRGGAALAFDKLQVDLGTVSRSQQGAQTFLVMNRGSVPVTIGPVQLRVEEGCDQVTVPTETDSLPPQQAALLPISFGRHRVLGPHRLMVSVPSSDPARPAATLSLHFTVVEDQAPPGTGPRLRVDKEVIDIGTVPYDWPMYEQFTLRNDGDAPLVLKGTPVVRVEKGC